MAKYGGAQVGFVLVDGYDLLGYSTEVDSNIEAMLEESHTLGDGWLEQSFVGIRSFTFNQKGFYDDELLISSNAALVGSVGSNRLVCLGLAGNTLGNKFIGFEGPAQSNFRRVATRGALHKGDADFAGSGQVDEGVIIQPLGALAGADGTAVDNTALTSNGGVGYMQATALVLGGFTSVTLKIRHSADNVTYADLVTFANITAVPAKERLTVAGTVNRYLRRNSVFNGAGAGNSITAFLGFKRVLP